MEYAISRGIDDKPAFAWWIKHVLRTRYQIISRLKARKSAKRGMKFGFIVPNSIGHALEVDKANRNHLWKRRH